MRRLAFLVLAGVALAAEGAEVTVCVVDTGVPNNPVYFYLPTTGSVLRCEINRPDYHPTLGDLYADGWRLIAALDPKVKIKPGGNERPSPVLYLERTGAAAGARTDDKGQGGSSSDKGVLKGLF